MVLTAAWFKTCIYFGCICGWAAAARPQFDTSTNMGLVLVPADAEVDSVIFRLRATDQDADFPLIFDITAAVQPIVRIENLPCTLYNKVCQANVILTRRLVPARLHDFAVRVRDSKGDSNSMQATISVTNATTPRDMIFPHVPSIIMVPEDTKPGKELDYLLVRANPWHPKPVYIELWQPKELFTIRQRQTPTQTRGVIILEGELDFETQSMYTLTMYATDPYTEAGKDTRNIAGVHVVVIVQDVQDVPPVFTIAPPLTRVNNSVKPGDVILRVHAEDGDKGTPREVTYGLVSEGNPLTPFFNISEWTGEITLARPLDELTQITHVGAPILLTVVAEEVRRSRDEPPGQATVVELGLLLGEPGNSPPYFESDSYVAWMDENAAPGSTVMFEKPYLTQVRDEDIGKTGIFALKLGNNNGTFEITPTVAERVANFVVTVRDNSLIDYEARKTLEFTIIAQEVGPATNLSTSVPVTIFLRDVNDNPPGFDKDSYEVTLPENVLPGTRVIQIHASDNDTGSSGSVKYTNIIGPGSETLTMDSETGLILVAKSSTGLDREATPNLRLLIEAADEDGKGLKSTVPLIVNILDVNDNAPIFEKSIYEFTLNADQTNFTSLAFIKAIDADAEPPNNEVRYELMHGNYGNKFYLNEKTGELILKEPLSKSRKRRNNGYVNFAEKFRSDFLQTLNTFQKIGISTDKPLRIWKNRKKRDSGDVLYTLTVRAYDLGVPHRSSTAKVNIITATPMGALTLMLVVPAEHLDPVRTTETLAAITGGRVTIQEIRPYVQPNGSGDSKVPAGKMSVVVARVEPTMSGTFLVDVETIHKSLVANGMDIVPVVDSNTNSSNESPIIVTITGNNNVGATPGKTDSNNGGKPIGATVGDVRPTPGEGIQSGTSGGSGGVTRGTNSEKSGSSDGNIARTDETPIPVAGGIDKGSSGGTGSNTLGSTGTGTVGNNNAANIGGKTESVPSGGKVGGSNGGTAAGKGESDTGGNSGGPDKGSDGTGNGGNFGNIGGVVVGTKDQTGVIVEENVIKINKTTSTSENPYTVYKAENKLLLWLLILLGLLMLLALLALILCCICPGCPFYMAPRKRRVHSFDNVNHLDGRPKRHLRRKQMNPVKAEWSGKKQAWSADPMRRNWQFNRRNTKNRGLASLPGDVALAGTLQGQSKAPSLRLRDGPEPWAVEYQNQKRTDDRLYVEDVEAGRIYDTEDVDSLRRHEMERGSDVLRHSYQRTDETSRFPREQHFYRDGNAEVLRLVTGGNHIEGDDISHKVLRPTTLVSEQQAVGYRSDGKEILLRRFIEDQNIRQHHDLHGSVQEIPAECLDTRQHEVIILPRNLEVDHRRHREERDGSVERLIIDHGDVDDLQDIKAAADRRQEADIQQQRKVAAAMLVGTAVSKAIEKPKINVEENPSSMNARNYAIYDVELAKQNALLTQLLMDRDARHLGVPGLDPGSYLETQSLPGQVAIATQTDRTAATQTENNSQVRSRSDNEESEEDIRSRRKLKSKKRFGSELRRSRSLRMKSPIEEESKSFSETRNILIRRKAKEAREGRRATLEPQVLQEISDSLEDQVSSPSPEGKKKAEYQSGEREEEDEEDVGKDKYHRRSHAKAVISEVGKVDSNNKKQPSPNRSKTRPQKSDSKSAESKKTNSDKKESDSTSAEARSNSKKKSAESQSNVSGMESKNEIEDKKKPLIKSISKSGSLKSTTEKPAKKNKIEEMVVTKKRSMLKHQKAKKVSTESSEFEEIPVKPKSLILKSKPLKQTESSSSRSNSKQDVPKSKETNTSSDEPKARSSGTDRDQISKRDQKQSESTSSTRTTEQEITKTEKAKIVQVPKADQSQIIVGGSKSNDYETAKEPSNDSEFINREITDKGQEVHSESRPEISKAGTVVLIVDELKPIIKDKLETNTKNGDIPEKVAPKVDLELPKSSDRSLTKEDPPVTESAKISEFSTIMPNQRDPRLIEASESKKKLEEKSKAVLEEREKIRDDAAKLQRVETFVPEIEKSVIIEQKEPEKSTTEVVETGSQKIVKNIEKVIPDDLTLSAEIQSSEKQFESSKNEGMVASEEIQDTAKKMSPKNNPQTVRAAAEIIPDIKKHELNPVEDTKAILQFEALPSSHESHEPLKKTEDEVTPNNDAKSVILEARDSAQKNETLENVKAESINLVPEKKSDAEISETKVLDTSSVNRLEDKENSVKQTQNSFTIISQPEETKDAILQVVSHPDEERHSHVSTTTTSSPREESTSKSQNDENRDEEKQKTGKETSEKDLENSQRFNEKLPSASLENKSIEESENVIPQVKHKENTDRNLPQKRSNDGLNEENSQRTESPPFYILSSNSSQEGFVPDRELINTRINPENILSENVAALVKGFSNIPTEQTSDNNQLKSTSGEWDAQRIQLGDISSDSPDNSRPYQTPRHRAKNKTGNNEDTRNLEAPEITPQSFEEIKPEEHYQVPNIKSYELTPRLIAEEAIRSGLEEIMKSETLTKGSPGPISVKTSPEIENQRGESSRRTGKPAKEGSRIPTIKPTLEKTGNGFKSGKKIEDTQETVRTARPKTEPKLGNPREEDTQMVRPRTQRGKTDAAPLVRGPKLRARKVKENVAEIEAPDLSDVKADDGVIPKVGYMSRYKQKRQEMERKRRELKEAAEEEQRPRWQRKPVAIPAQRAAVAAAAAAAAAGVVGKEFPNKEKLSENKTPESVTPRTRRRIKPLANAESEQLRAMVKEGRKQRKAEGGDSDDPTVEIFASEPPPKMTSFQPVIKQQSSSYNYDKIPPPFYLHPPPPPPHSSPQVSPLHHGPQDARRPDDDLDSGIAVSLQGGTKLRHQQLLEKKSVFDIAYNDAAPSQLRTDSTTPPS